MTKIKEWIDPMTGQGFYELDEHAEVSKSAQTPCYNAADVEKAKAILLDIIDTIGDDLSGSTPNSTLWSRLGNAIILIG